MALSNPGHNDFSCDLVSNAFRHRQFLEQIHELGVSLRPSSLDSLRRYKDLWLPMVHQNPDRQLIPPPDVAWLWHCHRLAPSHYTSYVTSTFGSDAVVEANPPFTLQTKQTATSTAQATRELWTKLYGNEESFFLSQDESATSKKQTSGEQQVDVLMGRFDLLASTQRQATFLWQISDETFNDKKFIEQGHINYLRFLKLRAQASKQEVVLIPTYQIDLMWHTHILSSVKNYNKDCIAIMGEMLHHDDSLNDRTEGGRLDVAFQATTQIWSEKYGEDYAVVGGMYRGEPPAEFFEENWPSRKKAQEGKQREAELEVAASCVQMSNPKCWAPVKGKASDGSPAFIQVDAKSKKDLANLPFKSNYVLGRTAQWGLGYYHCETREANDMIQQRVLIHCQRLESDVAMQNSCCGGKQAAAAAAQKEKQLADAKQIYAVMKARSQAPRPEGKVQPKSKKGNEETPAHIQSRLYTDNGTWLYPPYLLSSCGGSCGGYVAYNYTVGISNALTGAACGGGGCFGASCGGTIACCDCNCDDGDANNAVGAAAQGTADLTSVGCDGGCCDCDCNCDGVDAGDVAGGAADVACDGDGAGAVIGCCCPN